MERTGGLASETEELEIDRFREYVAFAMRGFGSFMTTLRTG